MTVHFFSTIGPEGVYFWQSMKYIYTSEKADIISYTWSYALRD